MLLVTTIVFANSYPTFSNKELQKIQQNSGTIACNRIEDYLQTMKKFKHLPKRIQLTKVNTYLNQLLPQVDTLNQKCTDYWETPKEFLEIGYGDCEDYVIIKYFTLIKLGFAKNRLFFTTVREKHSGQYHMVLSYFEDFHKQPLVLDNLSFRILDLRKRDDLKVDRFINHQGVFKLDEQNKLYWVSRTHKKFDILLARINKEKRLF